MAPLIARGTRGEEVLLAAPTGLSCTENTPETQIACRPPAVPQHVEQVTWQLGSPGIFFILFYFHITAAMFEPD